MLQAQDEVQFWGGVQQGPMSINGMLWLDGETPVVLGHERGDEGIGPRYIVDTLQA